MYVGKTDESYSNWRVLENGIVFYKKQKYPFPVKRMQQTRLDCIADPPMIDSIDFAAGGLMPAPGMASMTGGQLPQQKSVDKIRSVFPETWLWSNTSVGQETKQETPVVTVFLRSTTRAKRQLRDMFLMNIRLLNFEHSDVITLYMYGDTECTAALQDGNLRTGYHFNSQPKHAS